jgi:hypothetical protein
MRSMIRSRCQSAFVAALLVGYPLAVAEESNGPAAGSPPSLTTVLRVQPDAVGSELGESFIWNGSKENPGGVALGFRKTFDLKEKPRSARLDLFADARYILWVNGTYVERGPARFQPNGPEYDTVEIAPFLREGRNSVALLVVGNLSGGKVMAHHPGLTARLYLEGALLWRTDGSWRWSDAIPYRGSSASWADLGAGFIDENVATSDWTSPDFDDSTWNPAAPLANGWGPLTARRIPRLGEKEVSFRLSDGKSLPITLGQGERLSFQTGRIVQAYLDFTVEAKPGTELQVEPFGIRYVTRPGSQRHLTLDTRGFSEGSITVTKGEAVIRGLRLVERLYPFARIGSFECDDPRLNNLWAMCARSCEVLSEDSYVDCADRERVEWMDNTPPAYELTRSLMAGPGNDGKPVYSDPRLLAEIIRRTALTLQPDGWVKAHTCSDRYDIHAKMEDRSCDWVEGCRLYNEATGDAAPLRELWPALVAQMDYFLKRRTERGLVRARDWVVWGNPVGYMTGEGTTLNCFVARSLEDAARIGAILGEKSESERFAKAAMELKKAINTLLWNEREGTYWSGWFSDADIAESKRELQPGREGNLAAPTLHSSLFALDRGIVPADRKERVLSALLGQERGTSALIMTYYYLFRQLYALDSWEQDRRVLELMREKWGAMTSSPWQCSWEDFGGGSKAHIYGMYPAYFLQSYVLGVRRDEPVSARRLLIEPHLGDLTRACGTVVSEYGPVNVSWHRDGARIAFECSVPAGISTTLALPCSKDEPSIDLDGKPAAGTLRGPRTEILLPEGGTHTGSFKPRD